jgi:hypothetical protein
MDGNKKPKSAELEELIGRIAQQQKTNRDLQAEVERLRKLIADAIEARDRSVRQSSSTEQHRD